MAVASIAFQATKCTVVRHVSLIVQITNLSDIFLES